MRVYYKGSRGGILWNVGSKNGRKWGYSLEQMVEIGSPGSSAPHQLSLCAWLGHLGRGVGSASWGQETTASAVSFGGLVGLSDGRESLFSRDWAWWWSSETAKGVGKHPLYPGSQGRWDEDLVFWSRRQHPSVEWEPHGDDSASLAGLSGGPAAALCLAPAALGVSASLPFPLQVSPPCDPPALYSFGTFEGLRSGHRAA